MMKNYGLKKLVTELCVYTSKNRDFITLVYVDDFLCFAKNDDIQIKFTKYVLEKVTTWVIGCPRKFLGIRFTFANGAVFLDQTDYIQHVAKCFHLQNATPLSKPVEQAYKFTINNGESTNKPFWSIIGCLSYIAAGTRPDISYVMNELSQYQSNPLEEHYNVAK